MKLNNQRVGIWRLSLEQIEATVADYLGPGRMPGNQAVPCFSRQVAMYLAKNVAGWSTTRIGRFYNGRHHTTVLHGIAKIERLRHTDETLDALIEVLISALSPAMDSQQRFKREWSAALIDAVAARVLELTSANLQREIEQGTRQVDSRWHRAMSFGNVVPSDCPDAEEVGAIIERRLNQNAQRKADPVADQESALLDAE